MKLSPHWSPHWSSHSSSHSSPHSPHIRPTFIMRLYKQIKTTCGTLTISNHSKSLYIYIKLLAFKILSILVSEEIIITAVATYTLKVKIKKITISGEQIFSMFLCNLNVSHCNIYDINCTINGPSAYECYQLNFLVTSSIEFFYFHINDTDFYAHSSHILKFLGNNFCLCVFAS